MVEILLDLEGVSANDPVHRYLQFQFSRAVGDGRNLRLLRCESRKRGLREWCLGKVLALLPRRGELLLRTEVEGLLLELVDVRLLSEGLLPGLLLPSLLLLKWILVERLIRYAGLLECSVCVHQIISA